MSIQGGRASDGVEFLGAQSNEYLPSPAAQISSLLLKFRVWLELEYGLPLLSLLNGRHSCFCCWTGNFHNTQLFDAVELKSFAEEGTTSVYIQHMTVVKDSWKLYYIVVKYLQELS